MLDLLLQDSYYVNIMLLFLTNRFPQIWTRKAYLTLIYQKKN